MTTAVVTSCSREGYEKYGKKCIESFHTFWPREVALHIVSEDLLPVSPDIQRDRHTVFYNLFRDSTEANAFHVKHKDNPIAHGKGPAQLTPKVNRHWKTGYSFRHDAYKFSKKVFAIHLVASRVGAKRLIWLDADTVSFAKIPMELLDRVVPTNHAISCLDRGNYHSECGFVGYNLDHPNTPNFISEFAKLYWEGGVFDLQEWHDSWVFDWLRKKLRIPTYSIPYSNPMHPFVYSELGLYMDHLKGRRKDNGVSSDHPLFSRKSTEKIGKLRSANQVELGHQVVYADGTSQPWQQPRGPRPPRGGRR